MLEKIAIVGAGASGLLCSILLASKNVNVVLYEKNMKVGRKLLITGNGRCNITNKNIDKSNFYSENINFLENIFSTFDYDKCKTIFQNLGLEFTMINNRVYPMSLQASSVVEILEYEAIKYGVDIQLNTTVNNLEFTKSKFLINKKDSYAKVIIATGGIAMPKLGSNDSGYLFAKQFGHKIISPFPSLVHLVSDNKNLDMIAGVKIDGKIEGVQGDILFTKYGISGSAILDISRKISKKVELKRDIIVSIDILPNIDKKELLLILNKSLNNNLNKDIIIWLNGFINKKLVKFILKLVSLTNIKTKQKPIAHPKG